MPKMELKGPDNHNSGPATREETAEQGWSFKRHVDTINMMFAELYGLESSRSAVQFADVAISAAQLLALNTTPVMVLPSPGVGFANIIEAVLAFKPAGTAYDGILDGEDIAIKYTNASGLTLAAIETTGFLDQATAQTRYAAAYSAASGVSSITPAENAPVVAHMLVGNVANGTTDIKLRLFYRTIPTAL